MPDLLLSEGVSPTEAFRVCREAPAALRYYAGATGPIKTEVIMYVSFNGLQSSQSRMEGGDLMTPSSL